MKRIVHYVNQFFAGLGGEESASLAPGHLEGAVGPGRLLQFLLGEGAGIVTTVHCGDDHFSENEEEATARLLELIAAAKPDLLFAGPAFGSGRYGLACAGVCRAASAELGIPVLTAMALSNPGADPIRREIPVVPDRGVVGRYARRHRALGWTDCEDPDRRDRGSGQRGGSDPGWPLEQAGIQARGGTLRGPVAGQAGRSSDGDRDSAAGP